MQSYSPLNSLIDFQIKCRALSQSVTTVEDLTLAVANANISLRLEEAKYPEKQNQLAVQKARKEDSDKAVRKDARKRIAEIKDEMWAIEQRIYGFRATLRAAESDFENYVMAETAMALRQVDAAVDSAMWVSSDTRNANEHWIHVRDSGVTKDPVARRLAAHRGRQRQQVTAPAAGGAGPSSQPTSAAAMPGRSHPGSAATGRRHRRASPHDRNGRSRSA